MFPALMELETCASEYASEGIHRTEKGKLILNAGILLGREGFWLYQNTEDMWKIKSCHTAPFFIAIDGQTLLLKPLQKLTSLTLQGTLGPLASDCGCAIHWLVFL